MTTPATQRVTVGSGTPMHLGISTCPNDTFALAALLEHRIDPGPFRWTIDLLDIDQLNAGLFAGDFDVAKTSFHAALHLADQTSVLPVGSALGFGVGPLLLSSHSGRQPTSADQLTLCPGEFTTAKLLFDLFYRETTRVQHVVFSDIMPRLRCGTADFGVCIHEGRFTYASEGLHLVADLGQIWESRAGGPLPLGGLVMRNAHTPATIRDVIGVIDASLAAARLNPDSALPAMRRYAVEFSDDVLMQHVDLYVNDWTVDLGSVGEAALSTLSTWARGHARLPGELTVIRRSR